MTEDTSISIDELDNKSGVIRIYDNKIYFTTDEGTTYLLGNIVPDTDSTSYLEGLN